MYAHSIHNPDGVRFVGPLAPLASELKGEFVRLGYATIVGDGTTSARCALVAMAAGRRSGTDALTGPVIEQFLTVRRRDYSNLLLDAGVGAVAGDTYGGSGSVPESVAPEPCSGGERLLARFGDYLSVERGLTAPVIEAYKHWVRPFVEQVVGAGQESDLGDLAAVDVQRFLVANLPGLSRKSAQMTACALRSFLRFCYVEGIVAVSLAERSRR